MLSHILGNWVYLHTHTQVCPLSWALSYWIQIIGLNTAYVTSCSAVRKLRVIYSVWQKIYWTGAIANNPLDRNWIIIFKVYFSFHAVLRHSARLVYVVMWCCLVIRDSETQTAGFSTRHYTGYTLSTWYLVWSWLASVLVIEIQHNEWMNEWI